MKKQVTREHLEMLIATVRRELARVDEACGEQPQYGREGYSLEASKAWWKARDPELAKSRQRLGDHGARFTYRAPDGHAIHLAGIRSSSTSGWSGAFSNWITAAAKRVAREGER